MKRTLFLFTVSLFFLACSSDDDTPSLVESNEFNIKTFSHQIHFDNNTENHQSLRIFNESGQTIRESDIYSDFALHWIR